MSYGWIQPSSILGFWAYDGYIRPFMDVINSFFFFWVTTVITSTSLRYLGRLVYKTLVEKKARLFQLCIGPTSDTKFIVVQYFII